MSENLRQGYLQRIDPPRSAGSPSRNHVHGPRLTLIPSENWHMSLAKWRSARYTDAPSLKVYGRLFAWIPVHKSAEPGSLVVRIDADQRARLIASAPDLYYLTPHFAGFPAVLVRLSRILSDTLKELLVLAWSCAHLKPGKRAARKQIATRGGM